MPTLKRNRDSLFFEVTGGIGDAIVLLHGSLSDHTSWNSVVPMLAQEARVVAYDRRGHSQSEAAPRQDSIFEDADDLATIIEQVGPDRAHVVGTSGGAAIALRLACKRPALFLSLVAHEPPLLEALPRTDHWLACKQTLDATFQQFVQLIKDGDLEGGARFFVNNLSDGPGAWDRLTAEKRSIFKRNALTLFYECHDPEFLKPDFAGLSQFDQPLLFTQGGQSAPFFAEIIDVLIAQALPNARRHIYPNAGHTPHESHPRECARTILSFIKSRSAAT